MHPALTKLQTIEQAATKGPWFSSGDAVPWRPGQRSPFSDVGAAIGTNEGEGDVVAGGLQDEQGGAVGVLLNDDANLIVAARNALPALIAALVEIEQVATFLARPDEPGECETYEQAEHNGGRRDAAKDLLAIIAKHLEPLK